MPNPASGDSAGTARDSRASGDDANLKGMTNAFIVVQTLGQTEILRDESLTPQSMTDVWFATPESPLPARARALSANAASLAALQWEADVVKLWAFKDGALELEYDSSPSFANCTITAPASTGTGKLGTLFGHPENDAALERLLSRRKGLGFISESQRLQQILELLGVDFKAQVV